MILPAKKPKRQKDQKDLETCTILKSKSQKKTKRPKKTSAANRFPAHFFMKISNYLIYFPKIQLLGGN